VIILSKWDESKVDDDVFNALTGEYTDKYPITSVIQPPTPVEEIECEESDDGINYNKKGTACIGGICKTDYCSGNTLVEYYIEEEGIIAEGVCSPYADIFIKEYECTCSNGTCVQEETRCDVKDILSEGETKVYSIGGRYYEVEVSWIGGSKAKLKVNGEVTGVLSENQGYKFMDGSKINLIHTLYPTGEIAPRVEFCFEGALRGVVEIPEEPIVRKPVYVDLAVYPSFFVKEGKLDAYIIVGDTAPANDVIAATDIAAGLRGYAEISPARLVSEVGVEISENNNFIIVGNEAVEKLDSENLLDLEPWGKGEGVIQVFKDRDFVILTVTGSTEMDIRNAAKVLSKWEHFKLRGDRVKVTKDAQGNLVLSYPPFEEGSIEIVKPELYQIPEMIEPIKVPIPTCYDGVKNDGETGIDCGGPCKPCVSTSETCMTGCLTDSACLPFGTRIVEDGASMFCDLNQQFSEQKEDGEVCQNSYECLSNSCHSGKCVDLEKEIIETRGILEKILNWLKEFLE
jgi:hypothetical protein